MKRYYNGCNYNDFSAKTCSKRVLKSMKKKLAQSLFYCQFLVKKNDWVIHENLWETSKMFNITLKYFSNFNNKPPASWVAHIDVITNNNEYRCYNK